MKLGSLWICFPLLTSSPAIGWGNFENHHEITGEVLDQAERIPDLKALLRDELALPAELGEHLVLQLGIDAGVDEDLSPHLAGWIGSRLTQSWNATDGYADAPQEIRLVPNDFYCSRAPDRSGCVERLRTTLLGWGSPGSLIHLGVWAEDNPNSRSRHHFHDPERDREAGRGLDNRSALVIPHARALTEAITFLLRGGDGTEYLRYLADQSVAGLLPGDPGNFEYEGRAALERLLGGFDASAELPRNEFSLSDAEEFLFRGLTAEFPDQREGFLALHFLAVGHALHLIEDLSSPAHVRNDFVVEHAWGAVFGKGIEAKGESARRLASKVLATDAAVHLDTTGFDVSDFFARDARPGPHDATGSRGLAESVHDRFLSEGSLEQDGPYLWYQGYARPALPSCNDLDDSVGSGGDLVQVRDLPDRDLATGELVASSTQRYLTHRAGKRLAACRLYQLPVAVGGGVVFVPTGVRAPTTWNDGVHRDYFEYLWPLAVAYGRDFLQFYYQPRLAVIPTGPRTFRLANPTMLELEIPSGGVLLVYGTRDSATGLERRVTVSLECGGLGSILLEPATSPNALGPAWLEECELPASLGAAPAIDPTQFWIVATGRHGERGHVDGTGDRVVAFDRVTAEIFYTAERDGLNYGTDAELQGDIFRLSPSLADPRASSSTNITLETRAILQSRLGLTDSERDEIDFSVPSIDASGTRLAFGVFEDSVMSVPPGETFDPRDPRHRREFQKRIAVASIDAFARDPKAFREVDLQGLRIDTGDLGPPAFDRAPGSQLLVYDATESMSGQLPRKVVVYQHPETDAQLKLDLTADFWLFSAFENRLAGLVPAGGSLRAVGLADSTSGTCAEALEASGLRSDCAVSLFEESHDAPMFSPDGRFVTYERLRNEPPTGEASLTVMVADLSTGSIHELRDRSFEPIRGEDPSFSPDGRWLLYLDAQGELSLYRFHGVGISSDPIPITADQRGKGWGRWRPGLSLPSQ